MEIKEAQKSINKKVHYKNDAYDIDGTFILNAIIVRRENKKFIYKAELINKKSNSVMIDDISKIEVEK